MSEPRIQYRKLRAPQQHGSVLIDPSLSASNQLIKENQSLIKQSAELRLFGQPLSELRASARQSLLIAAMEFTGNYTNCRDGISGDLIFLSGHQPKLFHPGVWFKNLLLAHLAKKHAATAINLIIDNDLCGQHSIKVPQGSIDSPIVSSIAYDCDGDNLPLEEVMISDQQLFESFGQRVAKVCIAQAENTVRHFWNLVTKSNSKNIGLKFAQARHQIEQEHGIDNLELPMSTVCSSREFLRFCGHLLNNAERLQATYNTSLSEYRRIHKIRSHAHPVPTLERQGDAIEIPLWIWSDLSLSRKRLFCLRVGDQTELRDELGKTYATVNLTGCDDIAIDQLEALNKSGIKIRPRALTTTMYCRLVLSDLFVHGIGGAKYDQLTDHITRDFFNCTLPKFQIGTATVKLFANQISNPANELESIEKDLRDLEFSPDKFARKAVKNKHHHSSELESLIVQKLEHVRNNVAPQDRAAWHETLQNIHMQLRSLLEKDEEALVSSRQTVQNRLKVFELLDSREYPLILFNVKTLLELLESAMKTS